MGAFAPSPSRLLGPIRLGLRCGAWLCAFRIDVRGHGNLPRRADGSVAGGWILAGAPHRAWVDPLLVTLAWPAGAPRLVWLGDRPAMTRSWWRRRLFPHLGVIPVEPGGGPAALAHTVDVARSVVASGAVLALFVERGAPSPSDRTRQIAGGFAWIALAARAPVVPVVIGGAHRIVRGSPFSVRFLAPLRTPAATPVTDPRGEVVPLARGRRPAVDALVAAYRDAVAGTVREAAAWADVRAPSARRWPWLATLFR